CHVSTPASVYTLALHDALPICPGVRRQRGLPLSPVTLQRSHNFPLGQTLELAESTLWREGVICAMRTKSGSVFVRIGRCAALCDLLLFNTICLRLGV